MKQVDTVSITELKQMAENMYGNLVKAVVDIKLRKLVVDAEMHADEEQQLLSDGSKQEDLWGINLHPAKFGTGEFIEFDSMINIKPRQKNLSRDIEDENIRRQIAELISKAVHP